MKNTVMIVGTGNVGSSIGYCLINQRTPVNRLILVDIDREDAEGEALDLQDALAVSPSHLEISSGKLADAEKADLIILAAGAPQLPGQTRIELTAANAKVFKSIISKIMSTGFSGLFLVVSNPLDILTHYTWKLSGLPPEKIIGSGTILDTARLRYLLATDLGVNPKSVHAYQIGEHGDSEFALWSSANIGGQPIRELFSSQKLTAIENRAREQAYRIIDKKGSTYYGIGASVTRIINSIFGDERRILPVSSYDYFHDCFYGFPTIIGRSGIIGRIDLNLNELEGIKLQRSINLIRQHHLL